MACDEIEYFIQEWPSYLKNQERHHVGKGSPVLRESFKKNRKQDRNVT